MSEPAKTLAHGRRNNNWLAIGLVVSGLVNVATPIYYWSTSKMEEEKKVVDLDSGTVLVAPVVDPSDSRDIIDRFSSWAAKCILDRSPAGLDEDDLLRVLFNSETARKALDEFGSVKSQYVAKNLRSHIEIRSIDAQSVGQGIIKSRVTGTVIITGTVNDQAIQEVQQVAIDISFVRNLNLQHAHRYPLLVFGYSYADPSVAKK